MYKQSFPFFNHYPNLCYLDTAATGLKLGVALDAENEFAKKNYANVHRSVYDLGYRSSTAYEEARKTIARYFKHKLDKTIFTKGATDGINLFARSVIEPNLKKNTQIIISIFEHHSNYLIWQELAKKYQCKLTIINQDSDGNIDYNELSQSLNYETSLVAFTHASNITGKIFDTSWVDLAKKNGAWTLVDGAQMPSHCRVDLSKINADAYVISAHKLYGPNGIGALFISDRAQNHANPYLLGGGMVVDIQEENIWQECPWFFEAGTPHITGAVGFASSISWLDLELDKIQEHEKNIFNYLLSSWPVDCFKLYDPKGLGLISFNIPEIHAHDLATYCDAHNIAIRAGKICASPLLKKLNQSSIARISLGCYNDFEDVDKIVSCLKKIRN